MKVLYIQSSDKFSILAHVKKCTPKEAAEYEIRAHAERDGYQVTNVDFNPATGLIIGQLKKQVKDYDAR